MLTIKELRETVEELERWRQDFSDEGDLTAARHVDLKCTLITLCAEICERLEHGGGSAGEPEGKS